MPTIADLRRRTQRANAHKPIAALERLWIRSGSIYFTAVALALGLSANAVTLIGLGVALITALAFLFVTPASCLVGALGLQLVLWLDCADGEVARWHDDHAYHIRNLYGRFYDNVMHLVSTLALYFALMIGLWRHVWNSEWMFLLGFSLILCNTLDKFYPIVEFYSLGIKWLRALETGFYRTWLEAGYQAEPVPPAPATRRFSDASLPEKIWMLLTGGYLFGDQLVKVILILAALAEATRLAFFPQCRSSFLLAYFVFFGVTYPLHLLLVTVRTVRTRSLAHHHNAFVALLRQVHQEGQKNDVGI